MNEITSRLSIAFADRYRIERRLGEGGMATVYLAEDLKHDRKVALKVLKAELAAVLGAERFVQEIKTTASLQHPNILPLFDSGEAGAFLYYVMPYIEGETLRDKLNRETQLSIDEAVQITTDVAEALHAAHEEGVIHRDIKPENILLHKGRAMVADFGIALAVSAAAGGRMTETGLSLGTPHYMSPEQATAEKDLTARSDIYSLGTVLYEMLTGEPPHMGNSAQQIIMKIVTEEVQPVTKLRKSVPPNVTAAVAKSLEKLAADRFESAEKFADALTNPGYTLPTMRAAGGAGAPANGLWKGVSITTGALAALLLVTTVFGWMGRPTRTPETFRFRLDFAPEQALVSPAPSLIGLSAQLALSPDGTTLVYSGPSTARQWKLWVLRFNATLDAAPLEGTDGARFPTFSPAGDFVAFLAGDNSLRVIAVDGGPPVTVADSLIIGAGGLAWGTDGFIYVASGYAVNHIMAISYADQSVRRRVTRPDSIRSGNGYALPHFVRGGDALLVTMSPEAYNLSNLRIGAVELVTGIVSDLGIAGVYALHVPPYILVVQHDGAVVAAPFDVSALEVTGPFVPVVAAVSVSGGGVPALSVSLSGTLVYQEGTGSAVQWQPVWVSHDGSVRPIDPEWTANFWTAALSPNGKRLAATIGALDGSANIWLKEIDTGHLSQLTVGDLNLRAAWHPDGRLVSFVSERDGNTAVYYQPADGSSAAQLLVGAQDRIEEATWSSDGQWVVYRTETEDGHRKIMAVRPGGDSAATQLTPDGLEAFAPALSPNGHLLAYTALGKRRGTPNVYVKPFRSVEEFHVPVSVGGGSEPLWSHAGDKLFYRNLDGQLISVEIREGEGIRLGGREVLLGGAIFSTDISSRAYDVASDDKTFVMLQAVGESQGALVLVQNFVEELKAKAGN